MPPQVLVSGSFDDLRWHHVRFLEEAAKGGPLEVLLWSDALVARFQGAPPKFPEQERCYLVRSLRFVQNAEVTSDLASAHALPRAIDRSHPTIWAVEQNQDHPAKQAFCHETRIEYRIIPDAALEGFPSATNPAEKENGRRKVVVTGCYDWLHSGHVRFFEEVSAHGDLFVVVGHDANIRLLKGEGHPLFPDIERRYMVGAVRFVRQALISSGEGWLDADPEIRRLRPDIYAVNEDGDRGGKREYCAQMGLEYLVLRRSPAPGLSARSSTALRGF